MSKTIKVFMGGRLCLLHRRDAEFLNQQAIQLDTNRSGALRFMIAHYRVSLRQAAGKAIQRPA